MKLSGNINKLLPLRLTNFEANKIATMSTTPIQNPLTKNKISGQNNGDKRLKILDITIKRNQSRRSKYGIN